MSMQQAKSGWVPGIRPESLRKTGGNSAEEKHARCRPCHPPVWMACAVGSHQHCG